MKIRLVKHGETIENLQGIHQGQKVPGILSEKGRQDGLKLRELFRDEIFDAIYSSPLKRAYDTCKLILPGQEYDHKIMLSNAIIAKNSGKLGGRRKELIFQEAERLGIPIAEFSVGGENNIDVQHRINNFMNKLEQSNYENILIVTHGCIIVTYLIDYFGESFDSYSKYQPTSTAVTTLIKNKNTGKLEIISYNDIGHL